VVLVPGAIIIAKCIRRPLSHSLSQDSVRYEQDSRWLVALQGKVTLQLNTKDTYCTRTHSEPPDPPIALPQRHPLRTLINSPSISIVPIVSSSYPILIVLVRRLEGSHVPICPPGPNGAP
jgi:hypothetical protein